MDVKDQTEVTFNPVLWELFAYIISIGHVWKAIFMSSVICDNEGLFTESWGDISGY